jgi:hypothetical protein
MEDRSKDGAHREPMERSGTKNDPHTENTSANKTGGKTAPADRDAGSLEHGELGGNFTEASDEEGE